MKEIESKKAEKQSQKDQAVKLVKFIIARELLVKGFKLIVGLFLD